MQDVSHGSHNLLADPLGKVALTKALHVSFEVLAKRVYRLVMSATTGLARNELDQSLKVSRRPTTVAASLNLSIRGTPWLIPVATALPPSGAASARANNCKLCWWPLDLACNVNAAGPIILRELTAIRAYEHADLSVTTTNKHASRLL